MNDILLYRIQQAEDSLNDADILYNSGGSHRSIINRSYYAMFYAVLALFVEKGTGRSKHSGVISIFDREYVKTGIFDKELSKLLHRAFNLRQESDYKEFNMISKEEALEIKTGAKDFLSRVKTYLSIE